MGGTSNLLGKRLWGWGLWEERLFTLESMLYPDKLNIYSEEIHILIQSENPAIFKEKSIQDRLPWSLQLISESECIL